MAKVKDLRSIEQIQKFIEQADGGLIQNLLAVNPTWIIKWENAATIRFYDTKEKRRASRVNCRLIINDIHSFLDKAKPDDEIFIDNKGNIPKITLVKNKKNNYVS